MKPTNWKAPKPEAQKVIHEGAAAQGRREGFTGGRKRKRAVGKKAGGGKAAKLERLKDRGRGEPKAQEGKLSAIAASAVNADDDEGPRRQRHRIHTAYEKYFLAHHGAPPKTSDQVCGDFFYVCT